MAKSPSCQFATAGVRGLVTKVCGGESLGPGLMEFRSNNIPRRMSEPLAQLSALQHVRWQWQWQNSS